MTSRNKPICTRITVSMPKLVVDLMDQAASRQMWGYRNRTELVLDAVRSQLREMKLLD